MAVIGAAEKMNLSVVVRFAEMHESIMPFDVIGPAMLQMAKQSTLPVCAHLDHGETLPFLQKALNMGFTSIMYDGLTLSYDENVANTLMPALRVLRSANDRYLPAGGLKLQST
jgi:fructose-bisphosphate aldolase, class II